MKSSPIHRSRPDLGRRRFLGQAGCAGLSALPALSTLATLATTSALAADTPGGYRAVVCLLLTGGNDSFNMLAPRGTAEHAEYAQVRQDLALPRESLLALNPTTPAGLDLGLHPSMPELAALFESGKAAFIANVGTLLQPGTRKEQVEAGSVPVPAGLYSHSDQVEQWQTSLPQSRGGTGWAGRMADVLQSVNVNRRLSMNISVAGSNAWQAGRNNAEYAITPDGAEGLRDYAPPGTPLAEVTRPEIRVNSSAVDSQLALEYRNLLQQAFATSRRNAIEAAELFRAATAPDLPAGLSWPGSRLAAQLRMVARTISARDRLGVSRQTFFVDRSTAAPRFAGQSERHEARRLLQTTEISIEVWIDGSTVELFADGGTVVISDLVYLDQQAAGVALFHGPENPVITMLAVHRVRATMDASAF